MKNGDILCHCGKLLGHRGRHVGSKNATKTEGGGKHFSDGIPREHLVLTGKRDKLRDVVSKAQLELLEIEAKLEALKALKAAYSPERGLAGKTVAPPAGVNAIPAGRQFRIGEAR